MEHLNLVILRMRCITAAYSGSPRQAPRSSYSTPLTTALLVETFLFISGHWTILHFPRTQLKYQKDHHSTMIHSSIRYSAAPDSTVAPRAPRVDTLIRQALRESPRFTPTSQYTSTFKNSRVHSGIEPRLKEGMPSPRYGLLFRAPWRQTE